jgi:hypothetical protein
MSTYEDRLRHLQEHAKDAHNETSGRDDVVWPDEATKRRFEGVIAYARVVLEATDPELVSDTASNALVSALSQISNNATAVPPNADVWGGAVLDALAQLPISRGREIEQAIKDAASTFQRSAEQRLSDLEKRFTATKTEIETSRQALAQSKEETSTAIASLQEAFEARLAEFTAQIAAEQTALSTLRTTQTSTFEQAEAERDRTAKAKLEEIEPKFDLALAQAKREVESRVNEIRRMEQESAQLVGAIGLAGTAERYGEEVEEQKKVADNWRRATVVLALLAVLGVIVAVAEKHPAAETFAGKLALSVILGGVATYAARQSANHRRREQHARDLQLELTAFAPFIEPLSSEQQEEERVIMTRKTFGKTTSSIAPEEEPGPTPLSFALQRKKKELESG